jgi:hypothetical protein
LFGYDPTTHIARILYLLPDAKTNPTPLCEILLLDVLWPAYNVPRLLENIPLLAGLRLVAAVKLLYAYIPYYLYVAVTIPADINDSTCNFDTPSVFATPSANPSNLRFPNDNVPFTDTAPDDVVMIAFVD